MKSFNTAALPLGSLMLFLHGLKETLAMFEDSGIMYLHKEP